MKMFFFLSSRDAQTPHIAHSGAFRILRAALRIVNPYYARRIAQIAGA